MQINRDGFVFRNAYAFMPRSKQPTGNIDGCTLLWRFLWHGFWRTGLNVLLVCVMVVFVALTPLRFLWAFLWGQHLYIRTWSESGGDPSPTLWKWVDYLPGWLFFIGYWSEKNWHWPKLFGFRVLPIGVLATVAFFWGEYSLFNYALQVISLGETARADLWVGLFFVQFICIASVLAVALILFSIRQVRKSEFGQLVGASYRSFKERTCPVVEIVE